MNKNLSLGGISVEVTHNDLVLLHEMGQLLKRKARCFLLRLLVAVYGSKKQSPKKNQQIQRNKTDERT